MDRVSWGNVPTERADAARNRRHLLATAREMLAEQGTDTLTMDGLAERALLGQGHGLPPVRHPRGHLPGPARRR